ncbi:Ig-like domain-containing protein [Pseudomonas baetica]|uniref:Ig-like domain-containing protein n=1 Tax=Pseudomonas baetica TaxID=674054 RepID=UPI003EEDB52C
MSLVLIQQSPQAIAERNVLTAAKSQVAAKSGVHYQVIDEKTGKAPAHMVTKRVGKHLVVEIEGEERLVLKDYFPEVGKDGIASFDTLQANGETVSLTQASGPISTAEGNDYRMYLTPDNNESGLFAWASGASGLGTVGLAALGALAVGGVVAAASGGGGSGSSAGGGANDAAPTTPNAPHAPTAVIGDRNGDGAQDVSGTGTPGDTIVVTWPDATTSRGTVAGDGTWLVNVPATMTTNGPVTVIEKDPSGNVSSPVTVLLGIEVAPMQAVAITGAADDAGTITGNVVNGGVSDDTSLVLSGTLAAALNAGEVVKVYDGATYLGDAVVIGTTWTYATSGLAAAAHSFTAQVVDGAGNAGVTSATYNVIVETRAATATVNITAISLDSGVYTGDFVTNEQSLRVLATVTGTLGAGEKVQISLDNGVSWNDASLLSGNDYVLDNLSNVLPAGNYTFQARVVNALNQSGAVSSQAVVIDTTVAAPSTALAADTGASGSDSLTSNDMVNVRGLEAGASWQYQVDNNGMWVTGTGTRFTLSEGSHSYTVRQTDLAGNVSGPSAPQTYTLDTTAPGMPTLAAITDDGSTPGNIAPGGSTDDTTPLLRYNLLGTNAVAGDILLVRDGTAEFLRHVLTSAEVAAGQVEVSTPILSSGTHSFTASLVDAAGNTSVSSPASSLTITAPIAPVTLALQNDTGHADDLLTANSTIVVSGLATGATWEYSIDGISAWQTGSGDTISGIIGQGLHTVYVRQTDGAGQTSAVQHLQFTLVTDSVLQSDSEVKATLDTGYRWRGGAPGIITYSFPTTADGMDNKNATYMAGFQAITPEQQATMRLALMTWDDLIPQTFVEITRTGTEASGYSDIEFGSSTTYTNTATGSYPAIGSVWFNNDKFLPQNMTAYRFMAVEHEIGHTLGLAHAGVGSGPVDYYQNVTAYSVMSYYRPHQDFVGVSSPAWDANTMQADWFREDISPFGYTAAAQTPMLDDIQAIQSIYGVSTTTRTDNTTYGFNSTITGQAAQLYFFTTDRSDITKNAFPVLTLFDSAGNDTLDLSGWNSASKISLLSGTYSSTNQMTNNIAIAYNCVIENAIGGGGNDMILGNEVANILMGGGGNDLLEGRGGNDTLDGGLGMDIARYSGLCSDYTLTQNGTGDWTISDKRISSVNEGTDHLLAIERLSFLDGSLDILTATPTWNPGIQVL